MEYSAVVSKIKVRPHESADRLQIGTVCGVDVIVGLDTKDGDIGLYFGPDGQLSEEFAEANNLVGKVDPETGEKTGGYFGKNRRVRAQKFRGVNSYGFWIPMSSIDKLGTPGDAKAVIMEGESVIQFDGVPICNKYITPATIKALKSKVGVVRRANISFAKHFDTEHLVRCLDKIPIGSIIYFSEKLHGTSGRTGYVIDEGTLKRTFWQMLCCGFMGKGFKRVIPSLKYNTVTGTRNVILKARLNAGFYGNDEFRGIIEDKLKGLLKKGEIVYYEIVGYTTTGRSIMPSVEIKDKVLRKSLGKKTMDYTYGCKEKECDFYVYRITNVNEDGIAIDLSWLMVMERCKQLGVKHVPNLKWFENVHHDYMSDGGCDCPNAILYKGDSGDLLKIVETLVEGKSTVDQSHIREGVVVRVESAQGVKAYKHKSHTFLVLEGIAKEDDTYIDIEESS